MSRRVLVTGAAGFLGRAAVKALADCGFKVRAAVRQPIRVEGAAEHCVADVNDQHSLDLAAEDCDDIVHLVAIIKALGNATFDNVIAQGTANVVSASKAAKHFVYVSSLGTKPGAQGDYYQAKWLAEEAVRASGIPFTILRPSTLYGEGDEFINQFVGKSVPYPDGGTTKFQPVHVDDVAEVIASATKQKSEGVYEVGGPDVLTLREMITLAENKANKPGYHPSVPLGLAKLGARLLFDPLLRLGLNMPAGSDALSMLAQDNVCAPGELERTTKAFGVAPRRFREAI